jgi:hypothetical protein
MEYTFEKQSYAFWAYFMLTEHKICVTS